MQCQASKCPLMPKCKTDDHGSSGTGKGEKLQKEADFYGSMDGASKFVRGDAVAGIIITVVNVVGGILIGFSARYGNHSSPRAYTILSIGDGLVAQVPSIIVSIAVVFSLSIIGGGDLGEYVSKQLIVYPL